MEATRVTTDEVKERMDRGEQFTFVDTRNPQAWNDADTKLPGAVRVPADEVDQHLSEIPRDRAVHHLLHLTARRVERQCGAPTA